MHASLNAYVRERVSLVLTEVRLLSGTSLTAVINVPRPVPEGETLLLAAMPSATTVSPLLFRWDLDADGIFGELGASANHGDEVGQYPRFSTIGRDGSRIAAGAWPAFVELWNAGAGVLERGSHAITITNVAPSIDATGGPYTCLGASAKLSARASDPGGTAVQVLWDLDLDGVFGEVGAAAQNGNEVGAVVTFYTNVEERSRTEIVRLKALDGSLYSAVKSTTITVRGLSSTYRCPCTAAPTGRCAAGFPTGSAVAISSSDRKSSTQRVALTSRVTSEQSGAWFRERPIQFDRRTMDGFHFCGSYGGSSTL